MITFGNIEELIIEQTSQFNNTRKDITSKRYQEALDTYQEELKQSKEEDIFQKIPDYQDMEK